MKKILFLSTVAFFLFFLNPSTISAKDVTSNNDVGSSISISTVDNADVVDSFKKPKRRKKNKGRTYRSNKPKWQCFALWTNIHAASGPEARSQNRGYKKHNKKIAKDTKRFRRAQGY